jgi:hypothetical protein
MGRRPRASDPLARHLAEHHGVISRTEAFGFGLGRHQLTHALRTGRWLLVEPNVYRLATAPDSWHARARAAALSCRGLVSHTSALRVWGVDGWGDVTRLSVTIEANRRVQRRGIDAVRSTTLDRGGSFVADPRRKNRLLLAGWRVLTFTWADLADRPTELAATVQRAMRQCDRGVGP